MATVTNLDILLEFVDAIKQNNFELVNQLLKNGVDLNMQDLFCRTPLHFASRHYNFKIIKLLLEHGANPNVQDDYGWTPLHIASLQNRQHDIIIVLIDYGAVCDVIDWDGKTALDYPGGDFIKEYLESKEQQII